MIQNNNSPDIDWIESFALQSDDYDHLIHLLLEAGTPWSTAEIVVALLEHQLLREQEKSLMSVKIGMKCIALTKLIHPVRQFIFHYWVA
ncbi:MAG: hypothetical protein CM1200mP6_01620 [Anaerolineaceae bacterium]|nr:MAG: hypothetical protein CM1200mP6_01620 [Anaerolineaceae bacterium]